MLESFGNRVYAIKEHKMIFFSNHDIMPNRNLKGILFFLQKQTKRREKVFMIALQKEEERKKKNRKQGKYAKDA